MKTKLLTVAPLFALTACFEHGIDVTGTITVPPAVQALLSSDSPGQLVIDGDLGGGHHYTNMRAAVFCTPTDRDRTITIQDFTFACAKAETATFEARIRPLQAGDVDCSDPDLDSLHGPGPWDRQGALALGTARARVSVDDGVGACDDGSVSFTLTLAPTPR